MPLDDKLKEWARQRHQALRPSYGDMGGEGGKIHHMAYVNGGGAVVPHKGVLFFMQEFERITIPLG